MICRRNKHGYKGVRKRTDGRGKAFYARLRWGTVTVYSPDYATAHEAAAAYDGMALMVACNAKLKPEVIHGEN